jgi:hypothetical protein
MTAFPLSMEVEEELLGTNKSKNKQSSLSLTAMRERAINYSQLLYDVFEKLPYIAAGGTLGAGQLPRAFHCFLSADEVP